MSETTHTAPIFPPGRYGRRREPRRARRWVPLVLAGLVVVAGVLLALRLYQQYGDPTYRVTGTQVTDVTDNGLTVRFTVAVPPGGSARCVLRARAYSGVEVGLAEVTVSAPHGDRTAAGTYRLPTSEKAFYGEVLRCAAPRS